MRTLPYRLSVRTRIIIMLLIMLLVGVMFMAMRCCNADGSVCVERDDSGSVCVYLRDARRGDDVTCGGGDSGRHGGGGPGGPAATPTPAPPRTPVPTATPTPAPTPTPLPPDQRATGLYSYGDTATNCTDILNIVDPISIVVHIDQTAAFVLGLPLSAPEHIAHHGWPYTSGNGQYFQSGHGVINSCAENDVSLADGDDLSSRNHTRGSTQPDVIDWGYGGPWIMTPLTPHYDKLVSCGHAVPESVNPPGTPEYSGFSAARDTLISHWILDADAQHRFVIEASFWSNRQRMSQCNGDLPRSDGWVYFLGVCEVHSAVITPC
jgi:hypothetical protein